LFRKSIPLVSFVTYADWIERFFRYLKETSDSKNTRQVVNPQRIKDFLAWLALRQNVSASTQNHAFSALLFLCGLLGGGVSRQS
jgi:hypothetical protein